MKRWFELATKTVRRPGMFLVLLAAIGVPSIIYFTPEAAKTPNQPITVRDTASTAISSPPPLPLGTPIAAVNYTEAGRQSIALIDHRGNVARCWKGSENLEIRDVRADWILYQDTNTVFRASLDCHAKPKKILSISDLIHRKPREGDLLSRAARSPDGRRVVVEMLSCTGSGGCDGQRQSLWVGSISNGGWREIGTGSLVDWMDDTRVLINGYAEASAINANTGRMELLKNPAMWDAYQGSPDGIHLVYSRLKGGHSDLVLYDRRTHVEKSIRSSDSQDVSSIIWSPDGTRFIGGAADGGNVMLAIRNADGTPDTTVLGGGDNNTNGWLTTDTLWYSSYRRLLLNGIGFTAQTAAIELPGFEDGGNVSVHPVTYYSPVRDDNAILNPATLPIQREPSVGISFKMPETWQLTDCTSCSAPYQATRQILAGTSRNCECPQYELTFTRTNDSVDTVIDTLKRHFHADAEHAKRQDDTIVTLSRSEHKIGGITFQFLHFGFYEWAEDYLIGRVGGHTIVMQPGDQLDDPYLALVLDSMQFSS